jgi:hypothetical protein
MNLSSRIHRARDEEHLERSSARSGVCSCRRQRRGNTSRRCKFRIRSCSRKDHDSILCHPHQRACSLHFGFLLHLERRPFRGYRWVVVGKLVQSETLLNKDDFNQKMRERLQIDDQQHLVLRCHRDD